MADFENLEGRVTFNDGASRDDSLPNVPGVPLEFRTTEHFFVVDREGNEPASLDGIMPDNLWAVPRDVTLVEGAGRSDVAPGDYSLFPSGPLIAKNIVALSFYVKGPVVIEAGAMIGNNARFMGRTLVKRGAGIGNNCLIDNATIGSGADIGDHSGIRGTTIGEGDLLPSYTIRRARRNPE